MAKRVVIALLFGSGALSPIVAASRQTSDLQRFLAKRFKPGRGIFGAIASAIPVKLDPNSIAGMEGRKPDGSNWTSVFFNRSNVAVFNDPRNALAKFCASSGGTLKRLRGFDLSPKRDLNFFSIKLTDAAGADLVKVEVVSRWAASPPDETYAVVQDPYAGIANKAVQRIDARVPLGVFSCVSAQHVAVWHVAILSTRAGAWNRFGDMSLQGDAAVIVSVRKVDRAAVERVETVVTAKPQLEAAEAAGAVKREAERLNAVDARAALLLPKLRALQRASTSATKPAVVWSSIFAVPWSGFRCPSLSNSRTARRAYSSNARCCRRCAATRPAIATARSNGSGG